VLFGDPFGSHLGGPAPYVADHGETAFLELPDISRTAGAEKVLKVLGERWQAIDYAIQQLMPFLTWDFERTAGVWLDMIGSYFGIPRDERDDPYYRRVLAAYALIVYPRRRTTDGLLSALGKLIGDAAGVGFQPAYPKGFVLEIEGLTSSSQILWDAIKIIELGVPATYNAQIIVTVEDALLADDASGTVVIADAKVVADASGTVTFADVGLLSWVLPV
jgi:hypothetical protein